MMRALNLGFVLLMGMNSFCLGFGYGPQDGQPTQQILQISAEGTWMLYGLASKPVYETQTYQFDVQVPYTVTKPVEVNGKTVEKQFTEYKVVKKEAIKAVVRMVSESFARRIDPQTVEAFETDGRKIALTDLKKRIKKQTLVVVSGSDGMIPDYYAAAFKPGTIIIGKASSLDEPGVEPVAPLFPGTQPRLMPAPRAIPAPQPGVIPPSSAWKDRPRTLVRPVTHQVAIDDSAEEYPRLPLTPAPQLVFVSREGTDLLKVRQFSESKTEAEITVKANDSSVTPEVQMKVLRTTRHSETTPLEWKQLRVSTADAADVPVDRVKERLGAGETTVLMSADGGLVDTFWLQNIQQRVLVLRGVRLPPLMGPGHGMGYGRSAMPVYPEPLLEDDSAPSPTPAEAPSALTAPAPGRDVPKDPPQT